MGKVYRATDTRLHRQVAIKVSAARFSERFEREARVIASCALDRATGDGPALGQIFVITHAKAIAVEIIRDTAQRLTLGPEQPAFGDALANPLDNLTDFAKGAALLDFSIPWE
jgi:hypothetical protein